MRFVSNVFPNVKGSVLDVGCYTGGLGQILKPRGYLYFGIDIDEQVLRKAKERKLNVAYCDLDKGNIPFKRKFDYIVILDVLEHLQNPRQVIRKLQKNMAENSFLIAALPNDYHVLNRIRFLLGKPLQRDPFWEHGHLHIFPKEYGKRFLEELGFNIVKEYELPGSQPSFMSFGSRALFSKLSPSLFSRITLYICKKK